MEPLAGRFVEMQQAIAEYNATHEYATGHPWIHELTVVESNGLMDIRYQGEYELWFRKPRPTVPILHDLLMLLAAPEVAPRLRSFKYRNDAVLAANGTYPYEIDPLIDGDQTFPNLVELFLDQGQGEHGHKILMSTLLGDGWFESGDALARMLEKSPRLEHLESPSAPSAAFFAGDRHPLKSLDVEAGFAHANFIRRLADSDRFPQLRRLSFTDEHHDYLKGWRDRVTKFEDYERLFRSPVGSRLETIRLREVTLTDEQIAALRQIRGQGVEIVPFVSNRN